MRNRSPLAFAGVLIILLIAVMGFAAFSAPPIETAQTADGVVLPPTASGRIAGSVIGAQLATSVTPVPTEAPAAEPETLQIESVDAVEETTSTTEASTTTLATTTTTAAPTTTTVPPTTSAAAPTTTTTTPPTTTTTTTAAPTTTTTTPPTTTTTAPPDTTVPPPADHPDAVEQWRGLVEAYWPAELVEEALSVIDCESNGDPNAVNPNSGASGLFQFLPSTWDSAAPQAGWDEADVFEPEANIAVAYWLYAQFTEPWQQWSCKP